jgi:hypothetical protein
VSKLAALVRGEPVLAYGVIQSTIGLGLAFGLPLTAGQAGALITFVAAVLGFLVRRRVTPVKK